VTADLDQIVMTALDRNPERRWQSAASLREALRRVIEQPGNFVDNKHVTDWVQWVFTQTPGTESSGVSKLHSMVNPTPPLPAAADLVMLPAVPPMTREGWIWFAGGLAICVIVVAWLVWTIIG